MNQIEIMLELLRSAVLDKPPAITDTDGVNWDALMDMSVEQGVLAWVWDGICKLPVEQQPPRQQRINWGLSVQEVWDNYQKHQDVLQEMIALCDDNHMRLLLLKGLGLSSLYPNPQSRPCGDIDIYLFDDYYKGNRVFTGHDVERIDKHATFLFNNILIENHYYFLEPNTRQMRMINKYLESTLSDVCLTSSGYYVFSPIANLVFLTMHTLKHFRETKVVPYRNIIDFGMYLFRHRAIISPSMCYEALSKIKLVKGCEMLVYLSEMILDVDFKEYHFNHIPVKDVHTIKESYLIVNDSVSKDSNSSAKLKRQYRCIWRYVPRYLSFFVIVRAKLSILIRHLLKIPATTSIIPWVYHKLFR